MNIAAIHSTTRYIVFAVINTKVHHLHIGTGSRSVRTGSYLVSFSVKKPIAIIIFLKSNGSVEPRLPSGSVLNAAPHLRSILTTLR